MPALNNNHEGTQASYGGKAMSVVSPTLAKLQSGGPRILQVHASSRSFITTRISWIPPRFQAVSVETHFMNLHSVPETGSLGTLACAPADFISPPLPTSIGGTTLDSEPNLGNSAKGKGKGKGKTSSSKRSKIDTLKPEPA
ncbi:hypothetical protein GSI_06978 [Ganoderma sinense ZZ0214-1]|uniref:Uncharacterized protein n=1 Tax=Ganoderma sinense ZZ0214-1 TaxID=1077348 RepID=A0A2G8SAN1_9APHY|nr:hypothetical protein GSI_06978 [Ganoderma sinense ZZ0214-1]